MNRIHRTLWSVATQSWQAVPETAKSAGQNTVKSCASGVLASVALGLALGGLARAQAPPPAPTQLPTGGTVLQGSASIGQSASAQAAAMVVQQSSQRAVIQWDSFNLGSAASVSFVQPNAQAVTLNRVNDSQPSQIFGRINANGQVFLSNANGVYFSPSASVDVGAFAATTYRIGNDDFMAGRYVFERGGASGKIVNEGRLSAALGGYVALLAPEVQNAGVVLAHAGTVALAAGEVITLNVDGAGSLAGIATTPSAIAALIENKQAVQAPDGQIILSAVALHKLQAGVVKNSGRLEASSLVRQGGRVVLEGDDITLSSTSSISATGPTGGGSVLVGGEWQGGGALRQATRVTMTAGATIDASATARGDGGQVVLWSDVHSADGQTRVSGNIKAEAGPLGGNGGQVETSGHYLNVDDIRVSTKADQGEAGRWLLDPYNVTISESATTTSTLSGGVYTPTDNTTNIRRSDLQTALASGNVEVVTTGAGSQAGNIALNHTTDLSWSSASTLKLSAVGGISGTGLVDMTGGGGLIFNQAGTSTYSGAIKGNGFVIKQGSGTLTLTGNGNYSGGTTVAAGRLVVGGPLSLGTGPNSVASGATLDLNGQTLSNAGTLSLSGTGVGGNGVLINGHATAAATYAGLVSLASDSLIVGNDAAIRLTNTGTINATYNLTLGGSGTAFNQLNSGFGGGPGSLTKTGTSTWSLASTGVNTYTGGTNLNGGVLQLAKSGAAVAGGNNALGTTGTISFNGGTLQFGSSNTTDYSNFWNDSTSTFVNRLSNAPNQRYSFDVQNLSVTMAGSLTSAGGTLQTSGTLGTLILSGSNSFSGGVTLTSGTLRLDSAGAVGSTGAINFPGGTLQFSANNTTDYSARFSGTSIKINTNGQNVTLATALTGSGSTLSKSGVGTLTLTAANTFTGAITVAAGGTLAIGGTGSLGNGSYAGGINLASGATLQLSSSAAQTLSGSISNSGSIVKDGTGTLTLSGSASSFTGTVSVNVGTLRIASNNALGGTGGGTTVASGATLELGGVSNLAIGAEPLTIADGGTLKNVSGANSFAGPLTLGGDATITVDAGSSLNYTGSVAAVPTTKRLTLNTNGNLTFSANLTGGVNATYLQNGTGMLTMGNGSTLPTITPVYAGLYDASGNYSSEYGSTPNLAAGFFTAASGGTPVNMVAGTDYTGTAVWSGTLPTASSSVGSYSVTYASGLTLTNTYLYTFAGAASARTWNVTPKALTVSGTSVAHKTYDGNTLAALSGGALMGVVGSDNVTFTQSGTFAQAGVGTSIAVTVAGSLGGTAAGNYIFTAPTGLSANITPKALTLAGVSVANKTYDGSTTAALSGGALTGVIGSDNVTLTPTGAFATANAGTSIAVTVSGTLGGTAAGNYTLTAPTGLSADITPKALTITASNVSKTYDGQAFSGGTVSYSGFANNETSAVLGGALSLGGSSQGATNAGSYAITPSGWTSSNYAIQYASGTLTVNPLAVALTGAMNYSGLPSLNTSDTGSTLSVSNRVGSDVVTVTGTATLAAASAGTQVVTGFNGLSLSNANYTLSGASGSVTVVGTSSINVTVLSNSDVSALIGSQLAGLTGAQMGSFSTTQLQVFSAQQLAALSPAQLAGLSAAQWASLSPAQLQGLSPAQMALLTLAQLAGLSPAQLAALSPTQLQGLTPAQLASLSPAQVASLSAAGVAGFNALQLAAIGVVPTPPASPPQPPTAVAAEQRPPEPAGVLEASMAAVVNAVRLIASQAPAFAPDSAGASAPAAGPAAPLATPAGQGAAAAGVLAITILGGPQAEPAMVGIAFEQDADRVSLRSVAAPAAAPMTDKFVFTDRLTTFMVAAPDGEMVTFQGGLLNKRMVIVASTEAARRVARSEMNLVLAAAVTSLGQDERVMLAMLEGVVFDLR